MFTIMTSFWSISQRTMVRWHNGLLTVHNARTKKILCSHASALDAHTEHAQAAKSSSQFITLCIPNAAWHNVRSFELQISLNKEVLKKHRCVAQAQLQNRTTLNFHLRAHQIVEHPNSKLRASSWSSDYLRTCRFAASPLDLTLNDLRAKWINSLNSAQNSE